MSFFKNAWNWIKHVWQDLENDAPKIAIVVTQDLNAALNSGLIDKIVGALDPKGTGLPTDVSDHLKQVVPQLLAAELSIEGLPADPTPEQLAAFAEKVLEAFEGKDAPHQQKVYVNLAAEIYGSIKAALSDDGKVSFAEWVDITQKAYNGWKLAILQNPGTSMLPGGDAFTEAPGAARPYNPLDGVKVTQANQ